MPLAAILAHGILRHRGLRAPRDLQPIRSLSARRFSVITTPVELTPMLMPLRAMPRDVVLAGW